MTCFPIIVQEILTKDSIEKFKWKLALFHCIMLTHVITLFRILWAFCCLHTINQTTTSCRIRLHRDFFFFFFHFDGILISFNDKQIFWIWKKKKFNLNIVALAYIFIDHSCILQTNFIIQCVWWKSVLILAMTISQRPFTSDSFENRNTHMYFNGLSEYLIN